MKQFASRLTLVAALLMAVMPSQAQSPSALAPRSAPVGEEMAEERINALELRLAQLEQLLEAQKVLAARQQMTEAKALRDRLDALEGRLSSLPSTDDLPALPAPPLAGPQAMPQAGTTLPAAALPIDGQAANLQMRYNDMAESLRLLQGQTDRLMLQMRALEQSVERASADNEFRFQSLESGVRRANTGISSTSERSEVIGFVKRAAPVTELADATAQPAAQERLVGEGDLSVLETFGQNARVALADPKALYERALGDLQAGNYAAAELDFADLLATHPAHDLAGNAQYWLGETHYVRRQYKRAAQAFLSGYTTYAASPKAPDSLLKLGMTLTALGEKKTGCDAFAELNAKFPDAAVAVRKRAEIERKRADCGS